MTGITVTGYRSVNAPNAAMNILGSSQILVVRPVMIGSGTAGIGISNSDSVEISGALINQSRGDGVDVAGSTNVNIHDGACEDNVFTSIHPDCVQLWSVTGLPLQHLIVQNMIASGRTEGFTLWDHTDLGANDIQFLNNHAAVDEGNCIGVLNAHNLVVTGNDCHTLAGALGAARLSISSSPGAIVENNTTGANP